MDNALLFYEFMKSYLIISTWKNKVKILPPLLSTTPAATIEDDSTKNRKIIKIRKKAYFKRTFLFKRLYQLKL